MKEKGTYLAHDLYDEEPLIKEVLDAINSDRFCQSEHGLFGWIFDELVHRGDKYFHLADFLSYVETHRLIEQEYLTDDVWWRKAIFNVARIGKFSSDRTVQEYARDIWHIGQHEKSWRPAK